MKSYWHVLLALFSTAAVVAIVWLDLQQDGPGELSLVHAKVAELQQGQACELCHGKPGQDLQSACLECHSKLAEQILDGVGFHSALEAESRSACGECHSEHLGNEFQLTGERSFRLSGFPGPNGFEHGHGDYHLAGRHGSLQCTECHPNADVELLQAGEFRYIGLTQKCEACHDDPHDGKMMRSCESCHGQEHEFKDLSDFQHDEKFPLHASHGNLACAKCHEKDGPYSVAAWTDPEQDVAWRSCQECHQSPHREEFVGEEECSDCHSEKHATFAGSDVTLTSGSHLRSGFSLEAPHSELACEKCHSAIDLGSKFSQRYPGRIAEKCAECHQDPHKGQFEHSPYQEDGCMSCHQSKGFSPHNFDLTMHQETSFSLTGSHVDASCQSCHKEGEFIGVANQCEACHEDVHRDSFESLPNLAVDSESLTCEDCHQTTEFSHASADFDHTAFTHFPLKDAHAKAACEACHERSLVPDSQGRSFGRVSELHPGNPQECDGCHKDVHGGGFDQPGMPPIVDGSKGCARCHDSETFAQTHSPGFAHEKWTSFPLLGAHRQAECSLCHGSGKALTPPRRLGRVEDHFIGDPSKCQSCHADPHDGLFSRPNLPKGQFGEIGCARCHDNLSFRKIRGAFDHTLWTSFELQGSHAKAACSTCHPKLPRTDSLGRNSARAPGQDCATCHQDVHVGQFATSGKTDCEICHSAAKPDFKIADFDHDRQTNFLLDRSHQGLQCSACHMEWPLEGGGQAVRFRGIGTTCQDCHQVVPKVKSEGGR